LAKAYEQTGELDLAIERYKYIVDYNPLLDTGYMLYYKNAMKRLQALESATD